MINSLFRSLLMQGAGEEPVPGRWEYADYIYPKTTATHGIVLQSYKLSNTSNNLTIDFKIPLSTTSSTNMYLIKNNSFTIKPYYNSSNVLTLYITTSSGGNFTITSNAGTDDGTEVHRVTIKNGYVWLDKQLTNNTQAITTNLGSRPAIGVNFTSDCRIYNIYFYRDTETHSQVLFSKTHGFECPYSYFGSTVMNTINTVQVAEAWVGNFDYEPEYVDYIKPNTVDGFKLLNLYITDYPKTKLSCTVSQDYDSTIYTAGYYITYDDYYERGYNQLQGGLGSAVKYSQSPTQYTFSSVATGTKFTFDNFSGTPKMNGATGVSSNIGYDRTWTEDDEDVIKAVHTIWAGTKVYSFKISANGINTYDCLPVIPHYNVAWNYSDSTYIDGYLMDKNTGFRFIPVADVSAPSIQLVSYFKNPVDDPTIPFYIENVSGTTNNIYISIYESSAANFSIQYSTNNVNWNTATWNNSSSSTTISFSKYYKIITLPVGGRVYFKSFNSAAYLTSTTYSSSRYTPSFASTGNIVAGGNLSSLNNNNFTDSTIYVAASSSYLFEPSNTGANYLQDVKKMYICINGATNLNFLFYNCNQIDTVFISKHLNSGWATNNNFITNSKTGTIYFPTGMSIPTSNNGISSTWTKKNL